MDENQQISPFNDAYFMRQALQEAQTAFDQGEIPVGAVLVVNDRVIFRAHNQTELLQDVTAHAEVLAITGGAQHLGTKFLESATLYVTLEPCLMCGGAIFWSRLGKLVYGASDEKRGVGDLAQRIYSKKMEVEGGVLEAESLALLQAFFKGKRS